MKIVVENQLVNYSDQGDGTVILLLHGWGASLKTFDDMAAVLAKNYRVIRLDLPGFGESSAPAGEWGVLEYAQFVKAVLDKLEVRKLKAIIAHSFGGRVVIKAVGRKVLMPEKIVLIDSGGIKRSESARNQGYKTAAKVGKQLVKLPGLQKFHDRLRQRLYASAGSIDYVEAGELQQVFLRVINEDLRKDAGDITQSVLLIWGEDDTDTPPDDGELFREKIRHSKLIVIPGAGHFSYLDKPKETLESIKAFL